MKKTLKITVIIIASLLALAMAAICAWWIGVYFFGPEKLVSSTFNVGTLTSADGETTKNIVEVNYMSNANKNGYELLDIRFNFFQDETQNRILSQGLQFVTNNKNGKLGFDYFVDANKEPTFNSAKHKNGWYDIEDYYDVWGTFQVDENSSRYNYASDDDYETTLNSTDPLGLDSSLLIEIGNDLYRMRFKGYNTPMDQIYSREARPYKHYVVFGVQPYYDYYTYYSFDYFAYFIYNALQTKEFGLNHTVLFSWGDMFDYYRCTDKEAGKYETEPVRGDAEGRIIEEVHNNYAIKVTISQDGAQSYFDSIFNCVHGNSNWNINPDRVDDEGYFAGRSLIDCTLYNFNLVRVQGNNVALKLKDNFIQSYWPYRSNIALNVEIDLDQLSKMGYEFFGIANDSGLDNFTVYKIRTFKMVDGEKVFSEVEYGK